MAKKIKNKRKHAPEIYITQETMDFFVTDDKELVKFYELVNRTLAINYGYWGAMWRNYLYETDPAQYMIILSEKRLYSRIAEIDLEAEKLYGKIIAEVMGKTNDEAQAIKRARELVIRKIIKNPKNIK